MSEKKLKSVPAQPRFDLIGLFFHSFESKESKHVVAWQGRLVAAINQGFYLVETFDWLSGQNTLKRVVSLASMQDWHFYDTDADMKNAYETKWNRE